MTLTVRPDLEKKLASVAGQLRRDPQAVLDEVVAGYIEDEAEFLAGIREGREAIARGEGIPHAQVMAEIDAIIAEAEERLKVERRQ
jgi:predicted transcriptional regulator